MEFNATFKNISALSWLQVFLVEETRVPVEIHRPAASHWQILSYNVISNTPRLIGIRAQTTAGYILELTDQS